MKYIKNFKMLKEQSHKELLSLSELRKKYPEAVLQWILNLEVISLEWI
jgi:hypothetical protein